MATKYDSSILGNTTVAANFRAWALFLHDLFLLGWVKTADTGQVTIASMAVTSAAQQVAGYNIFRTNDGLSPVYVKLEYGSGATNGYPAIWITVGTGTDGAGNINGNVLLARTQLLGTAANTTTSTICFGSAANNRITFALFLGLGTQTLWFSLERRKDNNLADADTGIIVDFGQATTNHKSLCAPFTGVIPTIEQGLQFILTTNNPGIYNNTVPEGLRIPCLGPSEPPGRNVALCNSGDWGNFAEPSLTINGTSHVFKHCGSGISALRGTSTGNTDASTRLLLRYE